MVHGATCVLPLEHCLLWVATALEVANIMKNKDRLDQLKGQVLLPLDGERKVVRLKASDAEAYLWFKHIKVTLKLGK